MRRRGWFCPAMSRRRPRRRGRAYLPSRRTAPAKNAAGAYANGYTATGAKATQGVTIAADPDVLPMGTEIELDGHTYTVQDTGGAIAGNRLDLYFDSHEDALRWGVREKTVRWAG